MGYYRLTYDYAFLSNSVVTHDVVVSGYVTEQTNH